MEEGFARGYRNQRYELYARWQTWLQRHENATMLGMSVVMALATAALAQVRILTPLTPVPYTGQVFGVALTGGLLGRKWGTLSTGLYLAMGLVGLPVYAGQFAAFTDFEWFSGIAALTGYTGGYLIGFLGQAYVVGWAVDRRGAATHRGLVATGAATVGVLAGFILLDAYALSEAQHTRYYTTGVQAWFLAVLVLGEVAVVAAVAWLAWTSKARRERIEIFMGNVLGLAVVYGLGAFVFYLVFTAAGNSIGFLATVRGTVLPFIPADLTKIVIAIGLLTLLRPTRSELARRRSSEASPTNV